MMILHRLIIDLVAVEDGDLVTEVEVEGNPPFVTALGMVEMARQQLWDMADDEA